MSGVRLCVLAAVLVLGVSAARRDEQINVVDTKPEDPPEVSVALQDLNDGLQIKSQFNNFLERVTADTDKIHTALENEDAKVADLELEKQSLQTQNEHEKERLSHELETFKQKMVAKITDLKTTNRRLEETNMQLVATNDKLASELEAEKAKKELLIKKLKKMAAMFNKQQQTVQSIISQNSQRLETEVSVDVKDALSLEPESVQAQPQPAPVSAPIGQAEEDAMQRMTASLDDDAAAELTAAAVEEPLPTAVAVPARRMAPQPKPQPVPAPVQLRPPMLNSPKLPQPQTKVAPVAKVVHAEPAPAKVSAPSAPPTPKVAKVAPPVKAAAHPEDDEQLKALRSEVEKLEASVKTDDKGASASASASSASMLHIKKASRDAAKVDTSANSDSVSTLQQVGGMLSAAMADDSDDSSA